jgi:hypothetical protein
VEEGSTDMKRHIVMLSGLLLLCGLVLLNELYLVGGQSDKDIYTREEICFDSAHFKQENEALVYSLPSLEFEGGFSIPYPNLLRTKWYDDYYIIQKLVKQNDDFFYYWEVYQVEIN